MAGASLSYHKGLDLLNRLLHRDPDNTIKFRTYRDFCERSGKQIEDSIAQKARDILTAHHFDAESGKPTGALASGATEGAEPYQDNAAGSRDTECDREDRCCTSEQVKVFPWQIEDPKQTCYLSFDDIGVKHQKEHRAGNGEKKGVYVWNTVEDIETDQGPHIVTGVGMRKTFLFTLAYLLQHRSLAGKSLVFFTDGARDISVNITEMFSFHPYTVILDWYHLKKHCQEYLSMSVKGKEKRNEILQKLLRILWAGNVDEAIAYLQNLSRPLAKLNKAVKVTDTSDQGKAKSKAISAVAITFR